MICGEFANPIVVALDTDSLDKARALAGALKPHVGAVKLGLEFFTANGPSGVRALAGTGLPLMLDLKFHDIPNTVSGAVRELLYLRPAMVTVHASGGEMMMRAAVRAAAARNPRAKVLAVTILTSLDAYALRQVGMEADPTVQVTRLAMLAKECKLDGVVCSPQEIAAVRQACGEDFMIVTPGVRPAGSAYDDQNRVTTPEEAIKAGADLLVIGRPITGVPDPAAAAAGIAKSLLGLTAGAV